jgi:succinyl-CoA synthetase beta subunit
MRRREVSDPVAFREFEVESEAGVNFTLCLSIFAPAPVPDGGYICKIVITKYGHSAELYSTEVAGMDGVQALLLAAMMGGTEIENLAEAEKWNVPEWSLEDLLRLRTRREVPQPE